MKQNVIKWMMGLLIAVALGLTGCGGGGGGGSTANNNPAVTLTSITITPVSPSISIGATQQFTATGTYSDSTSQNISSSVSWSSSDTSKANISNAGLATAVAVGTTTIKAQSGSVSSTTTLTVASGTTPSSSSGITYTDGNNIFKLSPLTGTPVNLTNYSSGTIGFQRVSPSGAKLAYSYNAGTGYGIYVLDLASGTKTNIASVSTAGYGVSVCWSPDSQQVAFNDGNKLKKVKTDGTGLTSFATAPSNIFRGIDWSLTGNKIVTSQMTNSSWAYNADIYIMNSDGTNMTKIVSDRTGGEMPPAISPDGTKVIYAYDPSGYEVSVGGFQDLNLYLINSDGTGSTNISLNKPASSVDMDAKWSADGSSIVFVNSPNNTYVPKICKMDVTGANRTLITQGMSPDWF